MDQSGTWLGLTNCESQLRSSKPWYFESKYPNMTNCCRMNWSFFGSSHGRSPHDGAGTAIRRFFEERATPCEKLRSAEEVDISEEASI